MQFDLDRGIDVLKRTPSVLRSMLTDIDSAWATATEGPETWSPYDHGTSRVFEPYDRFAQFRESEGKSLAQLLDEFERIRAENLRTLNEWRLDDAQLALQGTHPAFGAVSMRQLLATWVAHDLGHLAQISRVMAKQYREEVGPWRAYLSVMDR